jgi:hypothetical protein
MAKSESEAITLALEPLSPTAFFTSFPSWFPNKAIERKISVCVGVRCQKASYEKLDADCATTLTSRDDANIHPEIKNQLGWLDEAVDLGSAPMRKNVTKTNKVPGANTTPSHSNIAQRAPSRSC